MALGFEVVTEKFLMKFFYNFPYTVCLKYYNRVDTEKMYSK